MDNREHKETIEHTGAKYSFGGAWTPNNRTAQQRKGERRVKDTGYMALISTLWKWELRPTRRSGNDRRQP